MIEAHAPVDRELSALCSGCHGKQAAPLATVVSISDGARSLGVTFTLCEECGRDAANAIGFYCIREGGWSKLEPRKRKVEL